MNTFAIHLSTLHQSHNYEHKRKDYLISNYLNSRN